MSTIGNKLIAERYAKAIFESIDNKEQLLEDTRFLSDLFLNKELCDLFVSEAISNIEKYNLVNPFIAKLHYPESWENFFKIVIDKHRNNIIQPILDEIIELIFIMKNMIRMNLTVAEKLSESVISLITKELEEILKKSVVLEIEVDQSIIGGFVAYNNSIRIDGSIKNNLIKFKKSIKIK